MTQLMREIAQLRDEMHSNFKWTTGVRVDDMGCNRDPNSS